MTETPPTPEEAWPPGGFWDRLGGVDDGGLPIHLPMGVTADGRGPENDSIAHHYVCWCGDSGCPLSRALNFAWESGRREGVRITGHAINRVATNVPRTKPYTRDAKEEK